MLSKGGRGGEENQKGGGTREENGTKGNQRKMKERGGLGREV